MSQINEKAKEQGGGTLGKLFRKLTKSLTGKSSKRSSAGSLTSEVVDLQGAKHGQHQQALVVSGQPTPQPPHDAEAAARQPNKRQSKVQASAELTGQTQRPPSPTITQPELNASNGIPQSALFSQQKGSAAAAASQRHGPSQPATPQTPPSLPTQRQLQQHGHNHEHDHTSQPAQHASRHQASQQHQQQSSRQSTQASAAFSQHPREQAPDAAGASVLHAQWAAQQQQQQPQPQDSGQDLYEPFLGSGAEVLALVARCAQPLEGPDGPFPVPILTPQALAATLQSSGLAVVAAYVSAGGDAFEEGVEHLSARHMSTELPLYAAAAVGLADLRRSHSSHTHSSAHAHTLHPMSPYARSSAAPLWQASGHLSQSTSVLAPRRMTSGTMPLTSDVALGTRPSFQLQAQGATYAPLSPAPPDQQRAPQAAPGQAPAGQASGPLRRSQTVMLEVQGSAGSTSYQRSRRRRSVLVSKQNAEKLHSWAIAAAAVASAAASATGATGQGADTSCTLTGFPDSGLLHSSPPIPPELASYFDDPSLPSQQYQHQVYHLNSSGTLPHMAPAGTSPSTSAAMLAAAASVIRDLHSSQMFPASSGGLHTSANPTPPWSPNLVGGANSITNQAYGTQASGVSAHERAMGWLPSNSGPLISLPISNSVMARMQGAPLIGLPTVEELARKETGSEGVPRSSASDTRLTPRLGEMVLNTGGASASRLAAASAAASRSATQGPQQSGAEVQLQELAGTTHSSVLGITQNSSSGSIGSIDGTKPAAPISPKGSNDDRDVVGPLPVIPGPLMRNSNAEVPFILGPMSGSFDDPGPGLFSAIQGTAGLPATGNPSGGITPGTAGQPSYFALASEETSLRLALHATLFDMHPRSPSLPHLAALLASTTGFTGTGSSSSVQRVSDSVAVKQQQQQQQQQQQAPQNPKLRHVASLGLRSSLSGTTPFSKGPPSSPSGKPSARKSLQLTRESGETGGSGSAIVVTLPSHWQGWPGSEGGSSRPSPADDPAGPSGSNPCSPRARHKASEGGSNTGIQLARRSVSTPQAAVPDFSRVYKSMLSQGAHEPPPQVLAAPESGSNGGVSPAASTGAAAGPALGTAIRTASNLSRAPSATASRFPSSRGSAGPVASRLSGTSPLASKPSGGAPGPSAHSFSTGSRTSAVQGLSQEQVRLSPAPQSTGGARQQRQGGAAALAHQVSAMLQHQQTSVQMSGVSVAANAAGTWSRAVSSGLSKWGLSKGSSNLTHSDTSLSQHVMSVLTTMKSGALRADGARSSGKSSAPSKNFRRGNSRLSLRLSSQQYAENDSYVTGQIMSSSALTGEPFSRGSYFSYPAHSPGSHTGVFRLSTSPPVVRPTQPSTSVPQAASNLDEHTGGGSTAPHAAGQTTATAVGPAAGMLPGGDTVQPACRLLPVFMSDAAMKLLGAQTPGQLGQALDSGLGTDPSLVNTLDELLRGVSWGRVQAYTQFIPLPSVTQVALPTVAGSSSPGKQFGAAGSAPPVPLPHQAFVQLQATACLMAVPSLGPDGEEILECDPIVVLLFRPLEVSAAAGTGAAAPMGTSPYADPQQGLASAVDPAAQQHSAVPGTAMQLGVKQGAASLVEGVQQAPGKQPALATVGSALELQLNGGLGGQTHSGTAYSPLRSLDEDLLKEELAALPEKPSVLTGNPRPHMAAVAQNGNTLQQRPAALGSTFVIRPPSLGSAPPSPTILALRQQQEARAAGGAARSPPQPSQLSGSPPGTRPPALMSVGPHAQMSGTLLMGRQQAPGPPSPTAGVVASSVVEVLQNGAATAFQAAAAASSHEVPNHGQQQGAPAAGAAGSVKQGGAQHDRPAVQESRYSLEPSYTGQWSTIIRPGRPGAQPMSAAHPVASAAAPSDPPAGLHSTAQQAAPSTLPPQRAAAVLTANSRAPPALSMPSQQPTSHYVRNMSNLLPGAPLASEPQLAAHFTAQLTLSHLAMAHTSSCITVLTLDGRVIFQNGRSIEYLGLLMTQHQAGYPVSHQSHILRRLFAADPLALEALLATTGLGQLWAGLVRMPYSLESRTGTTPVQYKSPCTAQATEPPPNVPVSVYAAFSSQHSNPDSRDNMAAGNRGAGHFASMSLPLGSTNFSMAMPNSKSSNLMMSGANPGPHNSHSTGNNNNNSSTSGRLVKSILVPQGSSATSPIRRAPTRSKSVHFEQTVAGGGVSEKSGSVQIARIKQRHAGGDHRGSSNASGDASSTQQGSGPGGGEGDNDRPSLQDLIGKDLLDEMERMSEHLSRRASAAGGGTDTTTPCSSKTSSPRISNQTGTAATTPAAPSATPDPFALPSLLGGPLATLLETQATDAEPSGSVTASAAVACTTSDTAAHILSHGSSEAPTQRFPTSIAGVPTRPGPGSGSAASLPAVQNYLPVAQPMSASWANTHGPQGRRASATASGGILNHVLGGNLHRSNSPAPDSSSAHRESHSGAGGSHSLPTFGTLLQDVARSSNVLASGAMQGAGSSAAAAAAASAQQHHHPQQQLQVQPRPYGLLYRRQGSTRLTTSTGRQNSAQWQQDDLCSPDGDGGATVTCSSSGLLPKWEMAPPEEQQEMVAQDLDDVPAFSKRSTIAPYSPVISATQAAVGAAAGPDASAQQSGSQEASDRDATEAGGNGPESWVAGKQQQHITGAGAAAAAAAGDGEGPPHGTAFEFQALDALHAMRHGTKSSPVLARPPGVRLPSPGRQQHQATRLQIGSGQAQGPSQAWPEHGHDQGSDTANGNAGVQSTTRASMSHLAGQQGDETDNSPFARVDSNSSNHNAASKESAAAGGGAPRRDRRGASRSKSARLLRVHKPLSKDNVAGVRQLQGSASGESSSQDAGGSSTARSSGWGMGPSRQHSPTNWRPALGQQQSSSSRRLSPANSNGTSGSLPGVQSTPGGGLATTPSRMGGVMSESPIALPISASGDHAVVSPRGDISGSGRALVGKPSSTRRRVLSSSSRRLLSAAQGQLHLSAALAAQEQELAGSARALALMGGGSSSHQGSGSQVNVGRPGHGFTSFGALASGSFAQASSPVAGAPGGSLSSPFGRQMERSSSLQRRNHSLSNQGVLQMSGTMSGSFALSPRAAAVAAARAGSAGGSIRIVHPVGTTADGGAKAATSLARAASALPKLPDTSQQQQHQQGQYGSPSVLVQGTSATLTTVGDESSNVRWADASSRASPTRSVMGASTGVTSMGGDQLLPWDMAPGPGSALRPGAHASSGNGLAGMSMNLNSSGVHRLAPAIEEDESCANSRAGGSGESKLLGAEDVLQHHSRSSRQHHHDALVMHPSVVSNTAGAQQHQLQQQVPDNTGLLSNHPAAPAPQGDDGAAQAMSAGRGIEVQQPSLSLPEFSGSLPDQSAAQQQLSQDMEAQQQQQAPHEERYMWHEVEAHRVPNPLPWGTAGPAEVLVLVQHDVTAYIEAQLELKKVLDGSWRLLESIFPVHVLEAVARAALGGPEPQGSPSTTFPMAGGTLPGAFGGLPLGPEPAVPMHYNNPLLPSQPPGLPTIHSTPASPIITSHSQPLPTAPSGSATLSRLGLGGGGGTGVGHSSPLHPIASPVTTIQVSGSGGNSRTATGTHPVLASGESSPRGMTHHPAVFLMGDHMEDGGPHGGIGIGAVQGASSSRSFHPSLQMRTSDFLAEVPLSPGPGVDMDRSTARLTGTMSIAAAPVLLGQGLDAGSSQAHAHQLVAAGGPSSGTASGHASLSLWHPPRSQQNNVINSASNHLQQQWSTDKGPLLSATQGARVPSSTRILATAAPPPPALLSQGSRVKDDNTRTTPNNGPSSSSPYRLFGSPPPVPPLVIPAARYTSSGQNSFGNGLSRTSGTMASVVQHPPGVLQGSSMATSAGSPISPGGHSVMTASSPTHAGGAGVAAAETPVQLGRVQVNMGSVARSHPLVTVLFADIKGFTSCCNEVPPDLVMAFLNGLFTAFDGLVEEHGVYKVETIGDCFMVVSGLLRRGPDGVARLTSEVDPTHASRMLAFAQDMLRVAASVAMPNTGEAVQLRVGIHSGPVMSGIVGRQMPRFCLFGDTVNTASRMESTGSPCAIQVSESTWACLGHTPATPRDVTPLTLGSPKTSGGGTTVSGSAGAVHSFAAGRLRGDSRWRASGGVECKGKGTLQTYLWKQAGWL